ncbi:hypothetical protein GBA52_002643 [Prunus armeniaca]|nr:hypothetical protein GBA52_002643 [Prunus armeniaca]
MCQTLRRSGPEYEFKEIEIYLEHLDYDVEDFLKKIHDEHPLAIIPSGSKDGVDIEAENGCDTRVETRNKEALVKERRRIGKGKAVVTEPYDSCDGYSSNDSRLVNIGYVMYKNDDIYLNTLVGDDWLGGISVTNTQGQVAHEFATEAITEATNGPELPANGLEEDTNGPEQDGPDQGANSHPQDGPGPEKGGNRPKNGPLEDIEEGDHMNVELWAASDGEEGGSTKRVTKYNPETDNHDL